MTSTKVTSTNVTSTNVTSTKVTWTRVKDKMPSAADKTIIVVKVSSGGKAFTSLLKYESTPRKYDPRDGGFSWSSSGGHISPPGWYNGFWERTPYEFNSDTYWMPVPPLTLPPQIIQPS